MLPENQDLRAQIATGYGAGVRVPVGGNTASCPMDTGALSPVVKWPGREANHQLPTDDDVKWRYTLTPPYIFMVQCLLVKHRDNLIFLIKYFPAIGLVSIELVSDVSDSLLHR
jgi:hypothetical protein